MLALLLSIAAANILILFAIGVTIRSKKKLAIVAVLWTMLWVALRALGLQLPLGWERPVDLLIVLVLKTLFNFLILLAGSGLGNLLRRKQVDVPEEDVMPLTTPLRPVRQRPLLGFQDRQLGWVFVAGALAIAVTALGMESGFEYWLERKTGISSGILFLTGPIVLYAIMRAFEAGRGGRG